jgi:hypothetical protein
MPDPKPMSYVDRLAYAQRILKAASFRTDPKMAIREMCESIGEIITALLEREQGQAPGAAAPGNPPSR